MYCTASYTRRRVRLAEKLQTSIDTLKPPDASIADLPDHGIDDYLQQLNDYLQHPIKAASSLTNRNSLADAPMPCQSAPGDRCLALAGGFAQCRPFGRGIAATRLL
jgi:hypothetical protein